MDGKFVIPHLQNLAVWEVSLTRNTLINSIFNNQLSEWRNCFYKIPLAILWKTIQNGWLFKVCLKGWLMIPDTSPMRKEFHYTWNIHRKSQFSTDLMDYQRTLKADWTDSEIQYVNMGSQFRFLGELLEAEAEICTINVNIFLSLYLLCIHLGHLTRFLQ